LVAKGVDIYQYNTLTSAADVVDVATAMGHEEWNLYGILYGTQLALTVMRNHTENVRSAILDGLVLLPATHHETAYAKITSALQAFFDSCKADEVCNETYPGLENVFYEAVDYFDQFLISVKYYDDDGTLQTPETFNGYSPIDLVSWRLRSANWIPYLPFLIYQARDGNKDVIDDWRNPLNFSGIDKTENTAARYSILCNDIFPFNDQDEIKADEETHPRLRGPDTQSTPAAVCPRWDAEPQAIYGEPVASEIPTLLLSGEFDPATPPFNAELAAATLLNSHLVDVPRAGHGVGVFTACGNRLIERFLDNPDATFSTKCFVSETQPFSRGIYLNKGPNAWYSSRFEPKIGPYPDFQVVGMRLWFLVTLIGGSVVYIVSRARNVTSSNSPGEGTARIIASVALLLGIIFLIGLLNALNIADIVNVKFGFNPETRRLFAIPYIVAVLMVITLIFAYWAGTNRWWSTFSRLYYSAVALSLVWFTWFLSYWEFIGP
jgi:pimeloyl-ACP methyl ester carboxylesterase